MYLKHFTIQKFRKAFPLLLLNGFVQFVCYYLPTVLPSSRAFTLVTAVDKSIPFVSWFIVFYVLAFPQWLLQWLFLSAEGEPLLGKYIRAEMLGKVIGLIVFIAYPVTMVRPADTGADLFGRLTALIYSVDQPTRLFPSMHCFLAWLWFRAVLEAKDMSRGVKAFTGVMAVLICASTVFVKQHLFPDVVAGILLAEACIFAAARIPRKKTRQPDPAAR